MTNRISDYYHRTMQKSKPKIQVKEVQTEQVLFECPFEESERAYQFAAEMEEHGLDVQVVSPTLTDTLSSSLGLSPSEISAYKESMEEELEAHEGSCCFEENDPKKNLH